jgi:hypothetical protein
VRPSIVFDFAATDAGREYCELVVDAASLPTGPTASPAPTVTDEEPDAMH